MKKKIDKAIKKIIAEGSSKPSRLTKAVKVVPKVIPTCATCQYKSKTSLHCHRYPKKSVITIDYLCGEYK
jgi:hypothetical protein